MTNKTSLNRLRRVTSSLTKTLWPDDEHWVRVVMNRQTRQWVDALSPEKLDALEISGDWWSAGTKFRSYRSLFLEQLDICHQMLPEKFDLILAEQVFEHVASPRTAARNVFEMLRPNGYFLITTPFLIRYHEAPIDCSRWTELGLRNLLTESGFEPARIRTNSWGNRACVISNFTKWTRYRPLLHSLKNEREFPVSVWAIAQRRDQIAQRTK
jgi:SAM-dependent methyltransferase